MRQIGKEHQIDPYQPDGSREIPIHPISASLAKAHAVWSRNSYAEAAHRYCVRASGMNLTDATLSETEVARFNSCLGKYAGSFELYTEEKKHYMGRLNEMDALQQNKYQQFVSE